MGDLNFPLEIGPGSFDAISSFMRTTVLKRSEGLHAAFCLPSSLHTPAVEYQQQSPAREPGIPAPVNVSLPRLLMRTELLESWEIKEARQSAMGLWTRPS